MNVCVCVSMSMCEHRDVCGCECECVGEIMCECWVGASGAGIKYSICLELQSLSLLDLSACVGVADVDQLVVPVFQISEVCHCDHIPWVYSFPLYTNTFYP